MAPHPVPTDANSLVLRGDLDLRIFIAVKNKPLPVFNLARAGDSGVQAFIPSAPGVVFEVVVYNGRKKMLKMNMRIEMWYGETWVVQWIVERKQFEPEAAADDQRRFSSACGVNIGEAAKPKEWDYATKTLHTTAVFYLRSLPWISNFLNEFFFEPTPVLPPPEPTVQIGNTLYVDTTEQEAEDDAVAEGPAKKRMKETPSGPEKAPSQVPVANDNAEKQERALEREAPTDDRNPVGATNDARASLASSNAAQPAHASLPTDPAQSALANAAAPIIAAARETALTVCEPASAVPATSVSASVAAPADSAGSASGAIVPSREGLLDFLSPDSDADAQAASSFAIESATSVFRKMVKQDPEFARLAEQSTLSLSSIIPESLVGNRSPGRSPRRDLSPTLAPNPPDDTTLASSSSIGISSLYTGS